MNRYRLTCKMQSRKDPSKIHPCQTEDRHPDLCKQQVEKLYPDHEMIDVRIEDLTPTREEWNRSQMKKPTAVKQIDLGKSWNKTLLK